ncbi:hypothetical protein PMI17_00820 [Pantoea sp. GM01]|nr:hypothetical protein PMI17_00820 [Pantoea sp. GM01]
MVTISLFTISAGIASMIVIVLIGILNKFLCTRITLSFKYKNNKERAFVFIEKKQANAINNRLIFVL